MRQQRKTIRLKNYDYSQNGYYMVTVCTKEKRKFLGEVIYPQEQVGADALVRPQNKFLVRPVVRLSEIGKIVEHYINNSISFTTALRSINS